MCRNLTSEAPGFRVPEFSHPLTTDNMRHPGPLEFVISYRWGSRDMCPQQEDVGQKERKAGIASSLSL